MLSPLTDALQEPFKYCIVDPYPTVQLLSAMQRALHYRDRHFHEGNIGGIAAVAADTLNALPRTTPKKANEHPQRRAFGKFLQIAKTYCPKNACVERCQTAFLAFKLAISKHALTNNPEFAQFAKSARLERQLVLFDHTIGEDAAGNVSLFFEGRMQPWAAVQAVALAPPPPLLDPLPKVYNPPVKYRADGVCNDNCYNWTELTPLKREENPSWGERYVLEICALCKGDLRFTGDHTWIRLKTPEGDIYAPGLYREDNEFWTAFSVKKGAIQGNDVSEGWDERIHTVSFEINEKQFRQIKQQVEKDHQSSDLPFHLVKPNCTSYALGLAGLAGIRFPLREESVVDHFVHKKVYAAARALRSVLPQPLNSLATAAWEVDRYFCSVGLNVVQKVLGGGRVSKNLSAERIQPQIRSPVDLLKPSKLEGRSPHFIASTLPKALNEARIAEAARSGKDPQELQYWIPDSWKCG